MTEKKCNCRDCQNMEIIALTKKVIDGVTVQAAQNKVRDRLTGRVYDGMTLYLKAKGACIRADQAWKRIRDGSCVFSGGNHPKFEPMAAKFTSYPPLRNGKIDGIF